MSQHPKNDHPGEETLRGTVQAVNFAPKGEIDGLLLDVDGEAVQVNVPPDRAAGVAKLIGRAVAVKVGPEPKSPITRRATTGSTSSSPSRAATRTARPTRRPSPIPTTAAMTPPT